MGARYMSVNEEDVKLQLFSAGSLHKFLVVRRPILLVAVQLNMPKSSQFVSCFSFVTTC